MSIWVFGHKLITLAYRKRSSNLFLPICGKWNKRNQNLCLKKNEKGCEHISINCMYHTNKILAPPWRVVSTCISQDPGARRKRDPNAGSELRTWASKHQVGQRGMSAVAIAVLPCVSPIGVMVRVTLVIPWVMTLRRISKVPLSCDDGMVNTTVVDALIK